MSAPEPDLFRAAMGQFASGVTVVTTLQGGIDHAMTANAFTSVSLDPPLVLVCVDKSTRFHQAVASSRFWGASILSGSQTEVAHWLSIRGRPLPGQLDRVAYRRGERTGAALLEGALCRLECRTWEMYDGGDHTIVVGEVIGLDVGTADEPAMVYFRSELSALPEAAGTSAVPADPGDRRGHRLH